MEARWSVRTWLLFALMALAWGLNYPLVSVGLQSASPLWLATLRTGVGLAGTVVLVTLAHGWGTLDAKGRRDAFLLGVPNTAGLFGFWFVAARSVPPGIASVMIYTFPFWVALLSAPVLGRPLSRAAWAAIATGFLGVALISQAWALFGPGLSVVPILELLAAALSWAVGTVLFQRRFRASQALSGCAYQLAGRARRPRSRDPRRGSRAITPSDTGPDRRDPLARIGGNDRGLCHLVHLAGSYAGRPDQRLPLPGADRRPGGIRHDPGRAARLGSSDRSGTRLAGDLLGRS